MSGYQRGRAPCLAGLIGLPECDCRLPGSDCGLPGSDCRLRGCDCRSPGCDCRSPGCDCRSPGCDCSLPDEPGIAQVASPIKPATLRTLFHVDHSAEAGPALG